MGKVALVTGATRGIGKACALSLARQGFDVVVTGRTVKEGEGTASMPFMQDQRQVVVPGSLDTTVKEVEALGRQALAVKMDVLDRGSIDAVFDATLKKFGRIDVLVNNAGFSPVTPFLDTDESLLRRVLDINLIGPILGMQAVRPHMARGSSIINISSTASLAGAAGRAHYGASKWGLRGVGKTVAIEFGEYGIRVNTVLPGAVDTVMISEATRAGEGFIAGIPIPRAGRPEEISTMVAFLASDASSYCTGQDFVVDGGATA